MAIPFISVGIAICRKVGGFRLIDVQSCKALAIVLLK
jgi:hypothetical protein